MSNLDEANLQIGGRIRAARELAGLSMADLAPQIGMTTSNLVKMERGEVTIAAARLALIAEVLARPVSFFYPFIDPAGYTHEAVESARKIATFPPSVQRAFLSFLDEIDATRAA